MQVTGLLPGDASFNLVLVAHTDTELVSFLSLSPSRSPGAFSSEYGLSVRVVREDGKADSN